MVDELISAVLLGLNRMNNPNKVSWESYSANPKAILDNPKLVIRDGDRYFNWNTCAAVAVGKIFFKKTLPRTEIEKLKEKIYSMTHTYDSVYRKLL